MTVDDPLEQLDLAALRQRTSLKWRAYPPDVLPLWVAEMDALPAEPVVDALHRALRIGDTGYPVGTGYADALAGFAAHRWGFDGIDPARTALAADVMTGVTEALRLVTGPGDVVVVNPPVYPPFYAFVVSAGRRILEAPLGPTGRLDLDGLAGAFAAAGPGAGYLLCSPHNPTGVVHTPEELTAVAALAAEHRVRVVVDEIHAPLVLPGARFTPYLSVPGAESGFAVFSASKGWNLAGLKAAVVVAGPAAGADLARLPAEVGHGASHLGVIAHTAALTGGADWLDALLAGLDRNRALLADLLADHLPGISWQPPEATYLGWLDCRGRGLPADDAYGFFLERARVALSSGPTFGVGGAGCVRLNFATSAAVLTEAVRRMAAAIG